MDKFKKILELFFRMEGIECSLFGLLNDVTPLQDRLICMGAKSIKGVQLQTIFGPSGQENLRTSTLLHLFEDSPKQYNPNYKLK